tara:strand:+ start:1071 stop:2576 length:1506 start_codon:yes stop_codon:yes gene_type:complete
MNQSLNYRAPSVDPIFIEVNRLISQSTPDLVFQAFSDLNSLSLSTNADAGAFSGTTSFNPQATITDWQGFGVVTETSDADRSDLNEAFGLSAMPVSVYDSRAYGLGDSTINVGADVDTLIASVQSTISATAQTTAAGSTVEDIDAVAIAAQQIDGLVDTGVSIGRNGSLVGHATITIDAVATNIGDPIQDGDDAFARIGVDADGIEESNGASISIGQQGDVQGQSIVTGGGIAETINGSAEVQADLDSFGLELFETSDISIGARGDISGISMIGNWNNGSPTDLMKLTASAVADDALTSADIQAFGIHGTDGNPATTRGGEPGDTQPLLTAGALGGDIIGQAFSGLQSIASTIGDPLLGGSGHSNAVSEIDSTIAGIQNVDLIGGQIGNNMIMGTANGMYENIANSVNGDAIAHSDVSAYGIRDEDGDGIIQTSGSIRAIATLSNTVVSQTVNGNAVAVATGSVVGLSGYSIHMNGSGSFVATAESDVSSIAGSVSGDATS